MIEHTVAGIAFQVEPATGSGATSSFVVTYAYAISRGDRSGLIYRSRRVSFSYTENGGYSYQRFGSSETIGLFGGVEHSELRAYSEATERAIGDILTMVVCDVVD